MLPDTPLAAVSAANVAPSAASTRAGPCGASVFTPGPDATRLAGGSSPSPPSRGRRGAIESERPTCGGPGQCLPRTGAAMIQSAGCRTSLRSDRNEVVEGQIEVWWRAPWLVEARQEGQVESARVAEAKNSRGQE